MGLAVLLLAMSSLGGEVIWFFVALAGLIAFSVFFLLVFNLNLGK